MTVAGEPTWLALEVRFDAEPIQGRVYEGDRLDRPFSGWLGLMAAIDAARQTKPPATDENGEGS